LLRLGDVLNRPSFGLYALTGAAPTYEETESSIASVDFAADLLSADLVSRQTYTATMPDGHIEFVTLQQTAVYRRGDARWLYAPPDKEFWGITVTDDNRDLTIVYPKRDEGLVRQLKVDLEQLLTEMCRTLADLNCPNNLKVTLAFSTDPDSLVNLHKPKTLWQSGLRVVLPTPTLVGLPTNDDAYDVLFQGYARQVATAVITHLVAWDCCIGAPFYQALLDYQLSQLDLLVWPVTQAEYKRVMSEHISLNELGNYWRVDSPNDVPADKRWLIYTTADFLLKAAPDISAATAQSSIKDWRSLYPWLENYTLPDSDDPITATEIDQQWMTIAEVQTRLSDTPPPIPLPSQDIQLFCFPLVGAESVAVGTNSSTLYRYRLAEEEWVEELTLADVALMAPMPDDTGVIIQSLNFNDTGSPYFMVLQDGKVRQEVHISDEYTLSFGQFLPGNGRVLAYTFDEETAALHAHIVDLTQCEENTCNSQAVSGLQAWSPNGTQFIKVEPAAFEFNNMLMVNGRSLLLTTPSEDRPAYALFRTADDAESVYIGDGFDPFWVDEETYGYVRPAAGNTFEVVIAKTADDITQILFDSGYLSEQAPGVFNHFSFAINYILVSPHDPSQLFVVTTGSAPAAINTAYIFSYSLLSQQLSLRVQTRFLGMLTVGFSPDGRYLIANGWEEEKITGPGGISMMILYDLNNGSSDSYITAFPSFFPTYLYDWSAAGDWLAIIVDDHTIALTLPEQNYYQIIQHDFESCASLAWINP
jgi:hypothetical protein